MSRHDADRAALIRASRGAVIATCPRHGEVDALPWHGALVCPNPTCHRTCAPVRAVERS